MTIALVFVIAFAWSLLSDIIPFLMGLFGTLKDEANIPQSFDLLFLFGEAIGIIGMVIYYRGDRDI